MSNFANRTTLGLSLLAFFLATHSFNAASAQTGTIVVAQSSDALTLDPSVDTSPISLNIFKNIYDQLTDIAADGSVKPQLATSWEVSADAKVWTFTIRTNVKFHDGSMLSVDDVVDSFQKIMKDEKSPVRAYLVRVASVEKVGDDKVRFTLTVPYAPFDRQVSLISILPRKAYAERGASFATNPVGSGPFRVVKWIKDDRIELAANPDYFGGAPKVATVIFRPVPAESARAAALASGEIDIVPLLPPSLVERLSTTRGIGVSKVDSNRVLYIGFDVTNPLLSNQKLRQAINHAINREAITTRLLRGLGKPIGQPVAPVTFGYDASIPAPTFDVDLAKRLVKESGYKGEPILFQYPTTAMRSARKSRRQFRDIYRRLASTSRCGGWSTAPSFPCGRPGSSTASTCSLLDLRSWMPNFRSAVSMRRVRRAATGATRESTNSSPPNVPRATPPNVVPSSRRSGRPARNLSPIRCSITRCRPTGFALA